jgi:hypothetical protein
MRCAIVEFNWYHDEVIPTLVGLLNERGISPDVYLPVRAIRKDALALEPGLRYSRRSIDGLWGLRRLRGTPSRLGRYDVVILNSIEPDDVLVRAATISTPTIAILHNSDNITRDAYRRYFDGPDRWPLFLGAHVAREAGPRSADAWVAPYRLGPRGARPVGTTTFCVQGNVEFVRRDYLGLIRAVGRLKDDGVRVEVAVVGRSQSHDGDRLRAAISEAGLIDQFALTSGELSFPDYVRAVGACHYLLPLLDRAREDHDAYFRYKISSSMSMALGLAVVPLCEESLASLYGVADRAVTYRSGSIEEGLLAAIGLSDEQRTTYETRLAATREAALARSAQNLARILDGIGASFATAAGSTT